MKTNTSARRVSAFRFLRFYEVKPDFKVTASPGNRYYYLLGEREETRRR